MKQLIAKKNIFLFGETRLGQKTDEGKPPPGSTSLRDVLIRGWCFSRDSFVFYDLEVGENPAEVKAELYRIARAEGLHLRLRHVKEKGYIQISYLSRPQRRRKPMRGKEARRRILAALQDMEQPVTRKTLLDATRIGIPAWNLQSARLLEEGLVVKIKVNGTHPRYLLGERRAQFETTRDDS